jgi:AhpD family alkylhydroperoxidase
MKERINLRKKGSNALKPFFGFSSYLSKSSLDQSLLNLIDYRVSQINKCAYCLDMHSKDLRAEGETEQRIYAIAAWREAPFYSDRERAALAWAEAVTENDVPDEVYEEALKQFTEDELIDLTVASIAINSWNRLNVAFRTVAGSYQPGQFAASAS